MEGLAKAAIVAALAPGDRSLAAALWKRLNSSPIYFQNGFPKSEDTLRQRFGDLRLLLNRAKTPPPLSAARSMRCWRSCRTPAQAMPPPGYKCAFIGRGGRKIAIHPNLDSDPASCSTAMPAQWLPTP